MQKESHTHTKKGSYLGRRPTWKLEWLAWIPVSPLWGCDCWAGACAHPGPDRCLLFGDPSRRGCSCTPPDGATSYWMRKKIGTLSELLVRFIIKRQVMNTCACMPLWWPPRSPGGTQGSLGPPPPPRLGTVWNGLCSPYVGCPPPGVEAP